MILQGVLCIAAVFARATSRSKLLGGTILSLVRLTFLNVLWFTAVVKAFWGRQRFIPLLMFLLGWINTFSRNETFGHVEIIWKPGLPPCVAALYVMGLACNNGCHCQLWMGQQSGALSGFQSTQPTSPHVTTLPEVAFLAAASINTWTKMLCFKGSGESGKSGMHNQYYFFGALTSPCAHLNTFGKGA